VGAVGEAGELRRLPTGAVPSGARRLIAVLRAHDRAGEALVAVEDVAVPTPTPTSSTR
jgi:hypothetical protein